MNLAAQDIRHHAGRFILTATGLGLLLMIVLGMSGIYAGLVHEATLLVNRLDADLWVVQAGTRGPFAEVSRVPASLADRLEAVPGVASAHRFVYHTVQRERDGKPWRFAVQGLDWPADRGNALPLVAGRPLGQAHYEMLADRTLGLALNERIRLGDDVYEVVGLTRGMTSSAGDPLAFFSLRDAQAIQYDTPGEAVRLERAARHARAGATDLVRQQPALGDRPLLPSAQLPGLGPPPVSAVLLRLRPGASREEVMGVLASWPDISVHTSAEQNEILLRGTVDRARRQLGLFRAILILVSAIVMALILYTLTLDKLHDIALLKLIGARNRVIVGLILQQALALGAVGYALAWLLGQWLFPLFPRLVLITPADLVGLALIVVAISVAASVLGLAKALRVQPNEVLS
jgi:putative ABC transport system permease protein